MSNELSAARDSGSQCRTHASELSDPKVRKLRHVEGIIHSLETAERSSSSLGTSCLSTVISHTGPILQFDTAIFYEMK